MTESNISSGSVVASENSRQGESIARTGPGILDKLRDTAAGQLAGQKDRATDRLGSVAQFVRQSTQQLRDQKQDAIAGYVERAADQIDQLSESLRNKDVSEILDDAQQLARKQPALFIGGAFVLGLIGARFVKSSGQANRRRSQPRSDFGGSRFGGSGEGGRQGGYGSRAGSFNRAPGAHQYGGTSAAAGTGAATITQGESPQTGRF